MEEPERIRWSLTLTRRTRRDESHCSSLGLGRSELLLPLRLPVGGSLVLDLLDLLTQTQLVKIVVQEQESVASLARSGSRATNPVQQFTRHRLDLRMAIGFLLAQDMPDDDEQFSCNGHNR